MSASHDRLRFERDKHIKYCLRCLQLLPTPYQSEDTSRMTLAFFALSSLDLLGYMESMKEETKDTYINWIYEQQSPSGGFRGGPAVTSSTENAVPAHLVMTYTALLTLGILGDDLSRLNRTVLVDFVRLCQGQDGSFAPFPGSGERDVRFVYCAFVILSLFEAFESISFDSALKYIIRCQSYDAAFGQCPQLESQGATTYCCIAALGAAGSLARVPNSAKTATWLVQRLIPFTSSDLDEDDFDTEEGKAFLTALESEKIAIAGFQGRPEKDTDGCYCFWNSAALRILHPSSELYDYEQMKAYLLLCQSKIGGLAKYPDEYPDLFHTYLGLAALALHGLDDLKTVDPVVNASSASLQHLKRAMSLHAS